MANFFTALCAMLNGRFFTITRRFIWTGYNKPMLITVMRTYKDQGGIFGHMANDMNAFKCATLENLLKAIPAGLYDLLFMWSEHFQQIMPHILVPGRTAVEVHWANYPSQLEGCVAVGTDSDFKDGMITESKAAFKAFAISITDQPAIKLKIVEDYGA